MHIDFISLLPDVFEPVMRASVVGRAAGAGRFTWRAIPLRSFASGRHRVTDEPPFGGGAGMVLKVEPLVHAIRWATHHGPDVPAPPADAQEHPSPPDRLHDPGVKVVLLDAAGTRFNQATARSYAQLTHLVFVCGRYEGVDERVKAHVDEELSVGDFILTGGELPALVVADAVVRLLPGTLGNAESLLEESHGADLLECPSYTRPPVFEGVAVPDILLSGNHAKVAAWRRQQSLVKTRTRDPARFAAMQLTPQDQRLLDDADGKPPPPKRSRKRSPRPT